MKILEVQKKSDFNLKEWVKRGATEGDYSTLIDEPTTLVDSEGKILAIYDQLGDEFDTKSVVDGLKRIKYQTGKRSRGLVSTSRIFGYRPRNEFRQDYCSATSLATEAPKEHELVCKLAEKLEGYYQKYNPEGYAKHKEATAGNVKEPWRMNKNSIFTSGIINKNNPLKYHFDTGNYTDVYSLMIVFKAGVEGGYLALPEYEVAFKLPHNAIFMFDGQSILHGVTPIKYTSPAGYRFSMVYYTLKRMWQCLEINEEIARIREKKTERERTRLPDELLSESEQKLKAEKRKMLRDRMGKQ